MTRRLSKATAALLLTTLTLLAPSLSAEPATAPEPIWSESLRGFESEPAAVLELVHSENHRTNAKLKTSKSRAVLQRWLTEQLNIENVTASEPLGDQSRLKLVDHGLGRATELIRQTQEGREVLLSNLNIKRNNTVAFIALSVSPDKKLAIVFAAENGSTDQHRLYIFDLLQTKLLSDAFLSSERSVTWTGPEKFVFRSAHHRKTRIEVDGANGLATSELQGVTFFGTYPIVFRCEGESKEVIFDGSRSVNLASLACGGEQSIVRATRDEIVEIDESEHTTLWRYAIAPGATAAPAEKLFEFEGVFQRATFLDDHYFIQSAWGAEQRLLVLDRTGKLIQSWTVPSFATLEGLYSRTAGSVVSFALSSVVSSTLIVDFHYLTGEIDLRGLEASLLTEDDKRYVSEIVLAPARDGVLIPVRLTRLESTELGENTPMLIQVYGGFGLPGFFYPEYSPLVRDLFLKKGGVLVGPAIRGGNEFGQAWYEAATGARKTTSFFDVIDVAKFLTQKKWTSPSRIILTGSSNGGFTAAGAALLEPQAFGLVIPVSGVFDLLGLNRLDPLFAKAWWDDYGNPDDASQGASIKAHAPLELEVSHATELAHFLFVSGLNDSRVNPLHTIKLVKKLRLVLGDSENLNAVFIKNSGHSITRPLFEDYRALRENLVVWDFIYQHLGW